MDRGKMDYLKNTSRYYGGQLSKALQLFLCVIGSVFCMGFQSQASKQRETDDERCRELVHTLVSPEDSLETINLVECQAPDGLTNWFSSDINKSVCTDKQCKMVNVRLFWDGVGTYHHFELINNEPLTKTDHSVFTTDDYEKLNLILKDSLSVFKDLKIEELVTEKREDVDGISGATSKSLSEYVVRDAVYTCFTLWHTVYGIRKSQILALLKERINKAYLSKSFGKNNPAVDLWVMNTILNQPKYSTLFFNELVAKITSEDDRISNLALRAISISSLNSEFSQMQLVSRLPKVDNLKRLDIIWKLSDCQVVYEKVILQSLYYYQNDIINQAALSYIYKIISRQKMQSPEITKNLRGLQNDKNAYVRNLTNNLLATWSKKQ